MLGITRLQKYEKNQKESSRRKKKNTRYLKYKVSAELQIPFVDNVFLYAQETVLGSYPTTSVTAQDCQVACWLINPFQNHAFSH
jgi:hypothetical protein